MTLVLTFSSGSRSACGLFQHGIAWWFQRPYRKYAVWSQLTTRMARSIDPGAESCCFNEGPDGPWLAAGAFRSH